MTSPNLPPAGPATSRLALAVADVNWFTTENLFREVPASLADTLLLKCVDYNNAWRSGLPPWEWGRKLAEDGPGRWRRDLVLPSGWMKTYPRLGMEPIARSIRRWRRKIATGGRLALVMTYPHYLHLRRKVGADFHVYFNVDDYALYWPRHAEAVNRLERRAVAESDLTICVAKARADLLRQAVPEAADRIRHLPHGTPSASITARPLAEPEPAPPVIAGWPRPLLGFVGTLGDRVDWSLLSGLADTLPGATIVLIGHMEEAQNSPWATSRAACLARPNVRLVSWQAQATISGFIRSFDVCLIPYLAEHPFNRACSPTKIMDYMATGRPIVSTDLPECRLYADLFEVADSIEGFIASVVRIVDGGSDDGRAEARHARASTNRCDRVAETLLSWLPK